MTADEIKMWSSLGTVLGVVLLGILNQYNAAKAEKQRQVALELAKKTNETGEKTHTLSNSNMLAQLRIVMLRDQRIADLTKLKPDIDAALESKKLYDEHAARQATVDSK